MRWWTRKPPREHVVVTEIMRLERDYLNSQWATSTHFVYTSFWGSRREPVTADEFEKAVDALYDAGREDRYCGGYFGRPSDWPDTDWQPAS